MTTQMRPGPVSNHCGIRVQYPPYTCSVPTVPLRLPTIYPLRLPTIDGELGGAGEREHTHPAYTHHIPTLYPRYTLRLPTIYPLRLPTIGGELYGASEGGYTHPAYTHDIPTLYPPYTLSDYPPLTVSWAVRQQGHTHHIPTQYPPYTLSFYPPLTVSWAVPVSGGDPSSETVSTSLCSRSCS